MSDEMKRDEMKSDERNQSHSGNETGFEREDLSTRGVFAFMIGLAIVGVVIYFIIVGMYTFLDKYERSQMSHRQSAGYFQRRDVACGDAGGHG